MNGIEKFKKVIFNKILFFKSERKTIFSYSIIIKNKDKRAQSVGIGLAKCPPIDKIEIALKNMDSDVLSKQMVLNLCRGN